MCIYIGWWFSHQVMSNSCDPMYCSLPGSSVHGILQARTLEWVAGSFFRDVYIYTYEFGPCFISGKAIEQS